LAMWGVLIGTVSLVMAFARTGPDEARSKLAAWAEFFGLKEIAAFLVKHSLDPAVIRYGKWMLGVLLFVGGVLFHGWIVEDHPPLVAKESTHIATAARPKQTLTELFDESGSLLG
jgi:hypothetical protein